MNNVNEIVKALNQLEKNKFCIDKQGKIFIQLIEDKFSLPKIPIKYKNQKTLLLSTLLHPEDRVIRKNIQIWIRELNERLNQYPASLSIHDLMVTFNLSALIFSLMGQVSRARMVCEKQMEVAFITSKQDSIALKYLLQPWVNLGRIDRIVGQSVAALNKFRVLHLENYKNINLGKYILDKQILMNAINSDHEVEVMLKTCSFLEPIKTYLAKQNYSKAYDLANHPRINEDIYLKGMAIEARIIAQTYLGKIKKAFYWTQYALAEVSPHLRHIFLLRQGEIFSLLRNSEAKYCFQKILELIYYFENSFDIQKTYFSTQAAQQFLKFGFLDLAKKAYEQTLFFAENLADEFLTLECLEALLKLDSKNTNYQDKFHSLVKDTGYHILLTRYSQSINSAITESATVLFNKLMQSQ